MVGRWVTAGFESYGWDALPYVLGQYGSAKEGRGAVIDRDMHHRHTHRAQAGGPPGLAFAFLLSAPATNLPSLLLLAQAGSRGGSRYSSARVALTAALVLNRT